MSPDDVSKESQPGNGGSLGFALRGYSPVVQWLQLLLGVGVIGFLVYRLNAMGWVAIWHALPRNIWFYALFAVWYLAIPVAECFIYRRLWDCRLSHPLPILLRKRVLNFGILGYLMIKYRYPRVTLTATSPIGPTRISAFPCTARWRGSRMPTSSQLWFRISRPSL